jgi:hypothetical protein
VSLFDAFCTFRTASVDARRVENVIEEAINVPLLAVERYVIAGIVRTSAEVAAWLLATEFHIVKIGYVSNHASD